MAGARVGGSGYLAKLTGGVVVLLLIAGGVRLAWWLLAPAVPALLAIVGLLCLLGLLIKIRSH